MILAVLYSGFLAAGISNVIVSNGVKVVGPTRTAAYQFLVPALAVVLAFLFLAEPIRAGQVAGGLVIVAGVLITRGGAPFRIVADRLADPGARLRLGSGPERSSERSGLIIRSTI